jgi:NAD(P)-dependent dehydrogenase (short-subunit alcohol dehydrogenase family)
LQSIKRCLSGQTAIESVMMAVVDLQLADQSFLVSGGSSGIGLSAARLLLQEGAHVTICARNPAKLEHAAAVLGSPSELRTAVADVTSAPDIRRAVEAAIDHAGRLDGLAAVAGRGLHGTLQELSADQVIDELGAKAAGLLHLVHAGSDHLRQVAGRVVALTAPSAFEPDPTMAAVSAGRAALDSLVRSLAAEYAPVGVRVNAVGVGLIDTPRQQDRYTAEGESNSYEEWLAEGARRRQVPMGRPGTADEVAAAIVWLLSPISSYTTGAVLDVTGGLRSR